MTVPGSWILTVVLGKGTRPQLGGRLGFDSGAQEERERKAASEPEVSPGPAVMFHILALKCSPLSGGHPECC